MFAFILCVGLLRGEGRVNEDAWAFILTNGLKGGSAPPTPVEHAPRNPAADWLGERAWAMITRAAGQLLSCQVRIVSILALRFQIEVFIRGWEKA